MALEFFCGTPRQLYAKVKERINLNGIKNKNAGLYDIKYGELVHPDMRVSVAINEQDEIIGSWSFFYYPCSKFIKSHFTTVKEKYRKDGIASQLWLTAIAKYKPKKIAVCLASHKGFTLVSKIMEARPNIKWDLKNDMKITPRDLRRNK